MNIHYEFINKTKILIGNTLFKGSVHTLHKPFMIADIILHKQL